MNMLDIKNFNTDVIFLESANYGKEFFCIDNISEICEDDKSKTKLIKTVEKYVRSSIEYKKWLTFLKGTLSIDFQCYHTGNLPSMCSLEIHHHPYTLFQLVDIMILNMQDELYTIFDLAKNVMKLHFMNLVGFVPLCISSHENYHAQILDIPIEVCEGNWRNLEKVLHIPEYIASDIKRKISITFNNARSKDEWKVKGGLYRLDKIAEPEIKHIDTSEWS